MYSMWNLSVAHILGSDNSVLIENICPSFRLQGVSTSYTSYAIEGSC